MAKHGKGRGWHGNSEGHAAVARKKGRTGTGNSNSNSNKTSSVTVKSESSHMENTENPSQRS